MKLVGACGALYRVAACGAFYRVYIHIHVHNALCTHTLFTVSHTHIFTPSQTQDEADHNADLTRQLTHATADITRLQRALQGEREASAALLQAMRVEKDNSSALLRRLEVWVGGGWGWG